MQMLKQFQSVSANHGQPLQDSVASLSDSRLLVYANETEKTRLLCPAPS